MNQLRPYQEDGSLFLYLKRRAILADEMGLGKTPQAAVALNDLLGSNERALIICPASLKINWFRELKTWAPKLSVDIGNPDYLPDDQVTIINYDMLAKFHSRLREHRYRVGIVDEAHYMKTLRTQRTREIRGWGGVKPHLRKANNPLHFPTRPLDIDIRWALTGTPILSRPMEVYPILKWLEVPWAKKEEQFGQKFCGGFLEKVPGTDKQAWNFKGSSNRDQLRKMLSSCMLRRLKKDVLKDLPPKTRQIIELEYTPAGRAAVAEEWNALGHKFPHKSYKEIAWMLRTPKYGEMTFNELSLIRKKVAYAKLDAAAGHIKGVLTSQPKVVVFAHHHDIIKGLIKRMGKDIDIAVLTGETPLPQRQKEVDRFQTDPACRLFVGNIQAAGVGLTLTSASLAVFIEEDWNPGNIEQAEDRIHRYGQKGNVLCQHLILDGSLDAYMMHLQMGKQELIDEILN